jgi:hypothetical protein
MASATTATLEHLNPKKTTKNTKPKTTKNTKPKTTKNTKPKTTKNTKPKTTKNTKPKTKTKKTFFYCGSIFMHV